MQGRTRVRPFFYVFFYVDDPARQPRDTGSGPVSDIQCNVLIGLMEATTRIELV